MTNNYILEIDLDIEIENIAFISDGGIFRSVLNTDLGYNKLCTCFSFLSKRLRKIFIFILDLLASLRYNRKPWLSNVIPLEIKITNSGINIKPVIPAATIKGLLRYAYDLYSAIETANCYENERISIEILKEIISIDKKILNSLIEETRRIFSKLLDSNRNLDEFIELLLGNEELSQNVSSVSPEELLYILLLSYIFSVQSYNSCLSVFDKISCSLPLSRELIEIRKLLKRKLSKLYEFTLCKSCLVFGCKGYKTPLMFTNAKPRDENDIKLIVRTFNQICQHNEKQVIAKTGLYTLVGFDENMYFNSKILLRYNSLYKIADKMATNDHRVRYIDLVIEVLENSVKTLSRGLLDCVIALGRRGSIGYGKVNIDIEFKIK